MTTSQLPLIETIAIGDELLTGRIADTNSAWVASQLFQQGLQLYQTQIIPDDEERIFKAIELSAIEGKTIVVFGGLGPTSDDKTAGVVAKYLGTSLVEHERSRIQLEAFLKQRERVLTDQVLKQIRFPAGTTALFNSKGLAPGFSFESKGALFFFLPGVPSEMKAMFLLEVLPKILQRHASTGLRSITWKCLGIPESELQRLMNPIESQMQAGERLGYRTRFPENHLTLYASNQEVSEDRFLELQRAIATLVVPFAYTTEEKELEEMILEQLSRKKARLAIAESCTGGLAIQRLTQVPGASKWVWGGCAVYQVEAKRTLLGVEIARPQDSVSFDCTRLLCDALANKSGVEYTAAITGYMGPDGGTAADPVGTIYWCVNNGKTRREGRVVLPGRERKEAQWGASTLLLREILRSLS